MDRAGYMRTGVAGGREDEVRRAKQTTKNMWEEQLEQEGTSINQAAEDADGGPWTLKRRTGGTWTGKYRNEYRNNCSTRGRYVMGVNNAYIVLAEAGRREPVGVRMYSKDLKLSLK